MELKRIPYHCYNKKAKISFSCTDYLQIDTIFNLSKKHIISIKRDPNVYGYIKFKLYDDEGGNYVSNCKIRVHGRVNEYYYISDSLGNFELFIPIEDQLGEYQIESSIPLSRNNIPMPCEKSRVITTRRR